MWPVILRELRAGSRRWTTYWLRLLAAGAVVAAIVWWLSSPDSILVRQPGREVFLQMHRVILAAIWIIVPLMAADCLSREKREGTLGLLFLTNLRAWNIVFAKAAAVGLTALTLWLSVIPIITVPVLLGGLPVAEILLSCSLALGSICFALAAGLLASAVCRSASGAVGAALCFAFFGHLVYCQMVHEFHYRLAGVAVPVSLARGDAEQFFYNVITVWNLHAPFIFTPWGTARGAAAPLNTSVFFIPLAALLVAGLMGLLAAFFIRRNWQDRPKTKQQTDVEQFFCAPSFFPKLFHRWMRRSLERNPIGWLETRSWTGRITAWIWLAVMISFVSMFAYTVADRGAFDFYYALMWLLLVSIAYVAAGSFRRERETGALELILVTPMSERQIISGRLRGLWSQFLPTFAIWVAVVLYLSSALHDWQVANIVRFVVAYLIVPVVGLYFSLRIRFVLLAWVATLVSALVLPQLFAWLLHMLLLEGFYSAARWLYPFTDSRPILMALQLALAALLGWRLRVNLARRTFSLR